MTFSKEYEKRILVMVAVDVERLAVVKGIKGDDRFEVQICGVGPVSAAAKTATILAHHDYDLVISAGIAGGFSGRADIGSIVVSSEIISGDLGTETSEGFKYAEDIGLGSSRVIVDQPLAKNIVDHLSNSIQFPIHYGSILTLATVTSSSAVSEKLMAREREAVAEAMEGFGVALAAQDKGIPAIEIRAISNQVGPRDKNAWRIEEALISLEEAFAKLTEVL